MEYVGSMVDPKNTHEYDWNEYLLDLVMKEVMKIQEKKETPLVLKEGSKAFEIWISGPFTLLGVSYLSSF
jgi:hypothetical protein